MTCGVAPLAFPAAAAAPGLVLSGRLEQGGYALGRTAPHAEVLVDGVPLTQASADGWFVVGFDRDAPASAEITVRTPDGSATHSVAVAPGTFDIQRIDGLPPSQVSPEDPVLLARIAAEGARKAAGFSSRVDGDFFRTGFIWPVKATRRSSRFGGQRILNGEPKRPHYGVDLAAPVGTPVVAPAAGVVAFAETGLHFEGGLVLIDHGQGLISAYLHLSRVDVAAGQRLTQGQVIGAVGKEGRATGPHLCWRLKWRDRNLDPSLWIADAGMRQ
ncbi:M23 family peptidase [Caulobacter flavus]|uniref:M23 family peptidase n=1 Tax=Caulobacter flavus TaxID=1679497 RepID=A0A2N5CLR2_9CAUL|nr:M23 family peptidase [Caulobacter flavus]PLR06730.1 M23 family peptidase [Caulobacter flavus]